MILDLFAWIYKHDALVLSVKCTRHLALSCFSLLSIRAGIVAGTKRASRANMRYYVFRSKDNTQFFHEVFHSSHLQARLVNPFHPASTCY